MSGRYILHTAEKWHLHASVVEKETNVQSRYCLPPTENISLYLSLTFVVTAITTVSDMKIINCFSIRESSFSEEI